MDKTPREIRLEAVLSEWKQYVIETKFNNDVLIEEVKGLREHTHQLLGYIEVLKAQIPQQLARAA